MAQNRLLKTTTTFLLHDNHEARYWHSWQARENLTASAEVACRTTLRRSFELVRFRVARTKAYGAAAGVAVAVAKAYQERLSQSKNTDQATTCFNSSALTIHDRMIRQPKLSGILIEADAIPRAENPFSGITPLLYILQWSQTEPRMFWALMASTISRVPST